MKKQRIFGGIALLIMILILSIPVTAFAMTTGRILPSGTEPVTGDGLTVEAKERLTEKALTASEKAGMSIYVVIRDITDLDVEAVARQEIVDRVNNGGGTGDLKRAVLFLINTNSSTRSFAIVEYSADGSRLLSEKAINKMLSDDGKIKADLVNGNYVGACEQFISETVSAVNPGFFKSIWMKLIAAFVAAGGASGLSVLAHKNRPRTPRKHYLKDGSIKVIQKNERRTGTTITKKTTGDKKDKTDHKIDDKTHGGSNTF